MRQQQCAIKPILKLNFVAAFAASALLFTPAALAVVSGQSLDYFNYRETKLDSETNNGFDDYGPADWRQIECAEADACYEWPDKFENSQGWEINNTNFCQWCPDSDSSCGLHHQSPINVERNRAILGLPEFSPCLDGHKMSFFDSSCSFDELREKNAFVIARHALRILQPLDISDTGDSLHPIDCKGQPINGRNITQWGRLDFPEGFSDWWLLSHIDFHVPSEHTQDGKRYSGEIQLYHYYEVSGEAAGVNNEMAAVSVFLEVYDDADDWNELNKVICAWREAEEKNRESCGYPSVQEPYEGCRIYTRTGTTNITWTTSPNQTSDSTNTTGSNSHDSASNKNSTAAYSAFLHNISTSNNKTISIVTGNGTSFIAMGEQGQRNLRRTGITMPTTSDDIGADKPKLYVPATSAYDVIMENFRHAAIGNTTHRPRMIQIDSHNLDKVNDVDWDAFIEEQYRKEEKQKQSRRLTNYEHVDWFNYFPMLAVKTEYYHRYSGTQTVPPCYGEWIRNDRKQTNHWRIMKDPVPVSSRQLDELHRLLLQRIAPYNDPVRSCQPDTGGAIDQNDPTKINVARPLQQKTQAHFQSFCECSDWESTFIEDRQWCASFSNNQTARLFDSPYNFNSSGF